MTPDNPNLPIPPASAMHGALGSTYREAAALPSIPPPGADLHYSVTDLHPGFVRSMVGDGEGNISAMRVVFVVVVLIVAVTWSALSIRNGALQPLPPGVVAALTALIGGKLWQNHQENSPSNPLPE